MRRYRLLLWREDGTREQRLAAFADDHDALGKGYRIMAFRQDVARVQVDRLRRLRSPAVVGGYTRLRN